MKYKTIFLLSILTLYLLSARLFALTLKEKVIFKGSPPDGYVLIAESVVPSPNLQHIGFVCRSKDKKTMVAVVDGKKTIEFSNIAKGYPHFSPDGKDFLILGKIKDKAYVLYNNKLSQGFDEIFKAQFTPDGKKIVFIAIQGGREFLIENGKPWKDYKAIAERISPVFSSDSKKIAIVALKDNGKSTISVNNKELGEYDLVLKPNFSPDSKHIAYPIKKNGKFSVVLDGKIIGGSYDEVKHIVFSPDSKHLAFVAKVGMNFFAVIDGKSSDKYQYVGTVIFSDDGKHWAYMAYENQKMFIVLDGEKGPKLDQIGPYFFSKNNDLLYMGVKNSKGAIFINNKPQKFYDSVGLPVVSNDGKHIAYRARSGKKWFLVLDKKEGKKYDFIRRPKFSNNGKHVAYIAVKNKKYFIVLDNIEGKKYPWTDFPYFSKDGNHMAYVASDGKNMFMVVDGVEAKEKFFGYLKGLPLLFHKNCITGQAIRLPGPKFYVVETCF